MSRILEAANGMCMPLPPGFHTLHLGLGVRCLPLHTLLHYIDNGILQLTETCVRKLLKGTMNTVFHLLPALGQKVRQYWNHPINANLIARKYVKLLLEKLGNRQVRPYEKQDHVNVRFVEETALKHTMTLLGLKYS
uniref:Gamma-secretase-activating protein C-terminal domain-containing protein n=1 Tax=Serinus canaria TaxID=9135 RepID=A0A8C9MY15_SERCA